MTPTEPSVLPALLARSGGRVFALPLAQVAEILRPLPTEPVGGMPKFIDGISVIRGRPIPVVELNALLDWGAEGRGAARMIVVRAGNRQVALAVEDVIGVSELDASTLEEMPPLLQNTETDLLGALGVLDGELLMVLQAARIIPEELWDRLQSHETTP